MSKTPNNNLSIYLIKKGLDRPEDILKSPSTLNLLEIHGIGFLYYGDSHVYTPRWIKKFFYNHLESIEQLLFNSSSKAILITDPIVYKGSSYRFGIPFGYGYTLLLKDSYEERFGLKVALNSIESNGLRRIDKKNLSSFPRDTSEQLSRAGEVSDFGINIEQDLIQSITGHVHTTFNLLGKTITGKDSASISAPVNIKNLTDFLKALLERYLSQDYKQSYDWIDQIQEIRNPKIEDELNKKLIEKINKPDFGGVWMAVPQMLDWSRVAGFTYREGKDDLLSDIDLESFLNSLSLKTRASLDTKILKSKRVYCIDSSSGQTIEEWPIYNCIYCEIETKKKSGNNVYLLTNGKWYEVNQGFASSVKKEYDTIVNSGSALNLPEYDPTIHKNENYYNEWVADKYKVYTSLDRKTISFGGGRSRIEFCDLLSNQKNIIHVKHYGQSAVLSHLFSQGLVSGELFASDQDFRRLVHSKVASSHKSLIPIARPILTDYEVTYAIISKKNKPLNIPFFSKVNLRSAKKRLEGFGYKVNLVKIDKL